MPRLAVSVKEAMDFNQSLSKWSKDKPLSILQLDSADRAVLKIADERDTVQKKTFTKWLNKHLKKHWRYLKTYAFIHVCYSCQDCCSNNHQVDDLFEDLRDGNKLISLLEVMSGETLSRERGKMRFHHLQNVQMALEFLQNRNVKLVNIRPEDIVDGNPKLTLGLIWTIILHFQISDIDMEDVSARAALLKWAQQTTEGYPGVKVVDFTTSWRDGLALSAILHRNRPDLFDFRSLKSKNAKSNLETAFSLAEKEFGITRLLDAEDVDTAQPDEKSLMTYIWSLYDNFQEPPNANPFAGDKVLSESSKFRSIEISKRLPDKQKLSHLYKDIEDSNRSSIQREIRIEEVDKTWDQTSGSLQNRDQKIRDESTRVEKLQRLADKFSREYKLCVERIEDIEKRMFEEEKRSPDDVKQKWDQIKNDFKFIDETLKGLQKDLLSLQQKNYPQITELQFRLQSLKDRSQQVKEAFQSGQSEKVRVEKTKIKTKELNIKQSLKEHFDWIDKKQKRIQMIDFGNDVQTIKGNFEQLKSEQKAIDQYKKKISISSPQKSFKDIDSGDMEKVQDKFNALVSCCNEKKQEFEMLLDFVQSASKELKWMSSVEETEIARDWSAKNLNLATLEHHQETLTSDLEKREVHMNSIQSQGENLLLQKHPASKCVEEYLSKMQNQWSWLLQLTFCLEVHLRYAQVYHKFFRETQESEQWLKKTEEKLNTTFNKTVSSIEEGEQSLQQMEKLRNELIKYHDVISSLEAKATQIVPFKQRRVQPSAPVPIVALCTYKSSHVTISKDDKCLLKEISNRMWKVLNNGKEALIPSVCFLIPPPNPESIELAQSLKKLYDDLSTLWAQRQKKLRQNLVFATIKVVKSWNSSQMRNVDVTQRETILKALNSDAMELIKEGTVSEPALMKLKQEMEQCNALFSTLVNKIPESDSKNIEKMLSETELQAILNEKEKFIKQKLQAPILWDLDSLEGLVIEHKNFDMELRELEDEINSVISKRSKKKTALTKSDTLMLTWDKIWQYSNSYVEKLKTVEVALDRLNEASQIVSNMEVKLASCNNFSSNLQDLQSAHTNLLSLQVDMQASQSIFEDAQVSSKKLKELMQKVRPKQANNADINKFENDLKKLLARWDSAKSQIVERLRSCGASYELLSAYKNKVTEDNHWISETTVKLNSLKTVKKMTTKEIELTVEPSKKLYSSISEKSFEETNTLGARYIREAKIYELRLKHYKDSLEEEHPSLDASLQKSAPCTYGVSDIEIEIKHLNERYSSLMQAILDYLTELQEDHTVQESNEMAVQENFQVCESNTTQLELWMNDVEEKLSDIGAIQGHLPGLQLQIYTVKVLKDELENKQNLITTCLDQMRNLAQRGLEVLSKEEINYLQKNLVSVREHYDALLNECNRFLKRLTSAFEELQKYTSEVKTFKEWLIQAQQEFQRIYLGLGDLNGLEKKSEEIRTFTSDVISHQADLRFIKIAAQKFIDESQDYLKILNEFRTNLPKKLSPIKASESEIKAEVQEVTTVYHNLLNEVNKLSDNYVSICSRYRSYCEISEKAQVWMTDIKKSSKKVLEEPVADESSAIQDQLNKVTLINKEVVGQGRLIDNIYQAWKILADTLDACRVASKDTKSVETTINSLQEDYSELQGRIVHRIQELQIALIHSQDIQGSIDRFLIWLEVAETKSSKIHNQPASLIIEKLESQVHECKILKSDINNQLKSIEMLKTIEISTDASSKLAKKVDEKLKDISQRFDKLSEKVIKRCQILEKVAESIHTFEEMAKQFDAFFVSALERIKNTDHHTDIDGLSSVIEFILNERDSKKKDFDQILKIGKELLQLKEVSDVNMVKDKIQHLEQQWKKLGDSAMEKKKLLTATSEQVAAYETLRAKVQDWFLKIERDLEKLEPLSVDLAALKKHANETMEMLKKHSEYSSTIEKLNSLGNSYDLRTSKEYRSSDAVKNSSNASARSSTDFRDFTPVQHQLSEINSRYNLLRTKLSERKEEIASITEEIQTFSNTLKVFVTYVDAKQKQLLKEGTAKETTDNKFKILKEIEKEMLEKHSQVDNLKINIHSLLSKRKGIKGSTELQQELQNLEKKWISLSTLIQENLHSLQNLKECQDLQQLMRNWLNQKHKMFQALGPVAYEPRMLLSQVQQIQVLRDEFTSQSHLMSRLTKLGASDEDIEHQWKDLSQRLLEREKELEIASAHSKQLHKLHKELAEKLQAIADNLDKYDEKGINMDTLLKKLKEIEDELDKLKPVLTDAFRICGQLCSVISDSSSKTEIKYKVESLEKSYNTLRKRIDDKKVEIQSSLKEDQVYLKICEEIQLWLNTVESSSLLSGKISMNISKLSKQIEEFEGFYKQLINKEQEVYLCLSRGSDMLTKISNKQEVSSIKVKLESIKKQYEKLKKTTTDRQTSLRSCLENCKKYQIIVDSFVPWLQEKEKEIQTFKLASLKLHLINKQLKEIQIMKSELTVQNQTFKNMQQLVDAILSNHEYDSDTTKKQLEELKSKWKQLNNAVTTKVQFLEELYQVLSEYEERFRDVLHKVQRLEDKMCSHDYLDISCDPVFLDRFKALLHEATILKEEITKLKKLSKTVIEKAGDNSSEITKNMQEIESRYNSLKSKLEERYSSFSTSHKMISVFKDQVKALCSELSSLEECYNNMGPIARDLKTLNNQLNETKELKSNLLQSKKKHLASKKSYENMTKQDECKVSMDQFNTISRQISCLEVHISERESTIENTITRVSKFYSLYTDTEKKVISLSKKLEAFNVSLGDVQVQQHKLKNMHSSEVAPLSKQIVEVNKIGHGLVQSVTSKVDTSDIERKMENINSIWNTFQESINEKEKNLEIAFLQSGKFQEALSGVQKWISDTEEMVSHQILPSSDLKVVKAQIEEQKFLKKMLVDRQISVLALEKEIISTTKTQDEKKLLKSITSRFDELISASEKRMTTLETIIPIAQEFQNVFASFTEWLETVDKRLHDMSSIPVEESQVLSLIKEQKKISTEIADHEKPLKNLHIIYEKFKRIINPNESSFLQQKIQSANEKFHTVKSSCENMSSHLNEAQKGFGNFSAKYSKIMSFIDDTTLQLTHFQVLSSDSKKLQSQIVELQNLKERLDVERKNVVDLAESGERIMKLTSGEDSMQIKEKLDNLTIKVRDISEKLNERLGSAEECLHLVASYSTSFNQLASWLDSLEHSLKTFDRCSIEVQNEKIQKMEDSIAENRSLLDIVNHDGSHLSQLSSRKESSVIQNQISTVNQRYEKSSKQVQKKSEAVQRSLQQKFEVVHEMDELSDWYQEIEKQVTEAGGLVSEPNKIAPLLKEQKSLCEEVNVRTHKVRDITSTVMKMDCKDALQEKVANLRVQSTRVSSLCQERLNYLEEAFSLAQHFYETHSHLEQWLNQVEHSSHNLSRAVPEQKPLVEKLNKTACALTRFCKDVESNRIEVIVETDTRRYDALQKTLQEQQKALKEALQATSEFSDQLDGMFSTLTSTADKLNKPIATHPKRIQEQIKLNNVIIEDLDQSKLETVQKTAEDVLRKASDQPVVKEIQMKVDRLNEMWLTIQAAAHKKGNSLEEALIAAERFWNELSTVSKAINDLQTHLECQESPAAEPDAVQQQQQVLLEIKRDISERKPQVDQCRQAGQHLIKLCEGPDRLDVQKNIKELDSVWENVTTLYTKREHKLNDAMDIAMTFHNKMQNLLEFIYVSEEKLSSIGDVSIDIDSVKSQITQLKMLKLEVDTHMIEVEALNRQAKELMEHTSSTQSIREFLISTNRRWESLLKCISDKQGEMDDALLKLGQFQQALEGHITWISKIEKTLEELKPVHGDAQLIETVIAKHKVITNDIQAHQSSIENISRLGQKMFQYERGSEDVKSTQDKFHSLQKRWQSLQERVSKQYQELEDALREAKKFQQGMQDLFSWLNETDGQLNNTKPIGGLPETAREQMDKFMDMYNELDSYRYKIEDILQQGQNYLNISGENTPKPLQHSLRTLKQKWESVLNKANDRKIKLEIALRETTEFHKDLQEFVGWLTNGEKYLTGLKPVSRHMPTVLEQIEEHRVFQKELGDHREIMLNLDKKGTYFKNSSRKQDVVVIKNLLSSVQQRWEKLVSKAGERTRALDHGYKEAKQFHDAYVALSLWLDEAEKILEDTTPIGNDSVKIKKLISKHREFQRTLGTKQGIYDSTMKLGRTLKDRKESPDFQPLHSMLDELKMRWNNVCVNSVNRQRKLEEALLYSGQFKDAVSTLLDWLNKTITNLSEPKPYHGDLDTVTSLIELHKRFEETLKSKGLSLENISKTSLDLKKQATDTDVESISSQVNELNEKWRTVNDLSEKKKSELSEAFERAKKLSEMINPLLEWLSEAENKLRFCGPLPEDEASTKKEIADHEHFMQEMVEKEEMKKKAIDLAHHILQRCHPEGVIRHWITILNSRWKEISTLAQQLEQRLHNHLLFLRDIQDRINELLAWLNNTESSLNTLEAQPLPDDLTTLDRLIQEHQVVINEMTKKQNDVDRISKASKQTKENSRSSTPRKSPQPRNESDVKHHPAKLLLEKWRAVWLLTMERQRRLQDRRNQILELHRMQNFDFNTWRKRYLSWLHNDVTQIMDQFKKIDKNHVGKVTKQEFIDGILQSKFATSRLEMERVTNIFDRNGDGFIDTKEYKDTLLPKREPQTEAEKIQDEVERQVAKCTCVNRFKVYQVGEGKYRFGDSQKLRLVRILRSTVMVRVGGGWVALDEFLVKNDPCRAKGRTNLELREQFILADGVSQSMTPFKTKHASDSGSLPSTGPIIKIREKSTPMRQNGSSSSISDNKSSSSKPSPSGLSITSTVSKTHPSQRGSQSSSPVVSEPDGIEDKNVTMQPVSSSYIKTKKTKPEASKIPSVQKSPKQPAVQEMEK